MRYSFALTPLCAALAVASPIVKKGIEVAAPAAQVDVVTNVVMVTVTAEPVVITQTAGAETQAAPAVVTVSAPAPHRHGHSQAAAPPAPAATSSSSPAVVVVTTSQAAPAATSTSEAPVVQVVATSSSSAAAAATTATAASGLQASAVQVHNNARASHQASTMTWNQTLADYAAQEGSCTKFEHIMTAGGGGYGQNIAVAGSSSATAYDNPTALKNAMDEWYAEESLYNTGNLYGVASPSEAVGDFLHFTQMVWLGSTEVGCAVINCDTSNSIYPGMHIWYSVCNYYPQGNVLGSFGTNVLS